MRIDPAPMPPRGSDGRAPAQPGQEAARAVAEVVRITLLDDAGRQDMRDHLARRHVAGRLGFAALRATEACPAPPVPAGLPHPGAPAGTARYRAVAAATTAPGRSTDDGPCDLST